MTTPTDRAFRFSPFLFKRVPSLWTSCAFVTRATAYSAEPCSLQGTRSGISVRFLFLVCPENMNPLPNVILRFEKTYTTFWVMILLSTHRASTDYFLHTFGSLDVQLTFSISYPKSNFPRKQIVEVVCFSQRIEIISNHWNHNCITFVFCISS